MAIRGVPHIGHIGRWKALPRPVRFGAIPLYDAPFLQAANPLSTCRGREPHLDGKRFVSRPCRLAATQ
jgi:hypothetical protein